MRITPRRFVATHQTSPQAYKRLVQQGGNKPSIPNRSKADYTGFFNS